MSIVFLFSALFTLPYAARAATTLADASVIPPFHTTAKTVARDVCQDAQRFAPSSDFTVSRALRCCTGTSNCFSVGASIENAVTSAGNVCLPLQPPVLRVREGKAHTDGCERVQS